MKAMGLPRAARRYDNGFSLHLSADGGTPEGAVSRRALTPNPSRCLETT